MNLIFLNTLEKQTGEGRVKSAQVSIHEEQGAWQVVWSEPAADGKPANNVWFEGESANWNEMLQAFREGIRAKIRDGFSPLIEGFDATPSYSEKKRAVQMLQFYAEKLVNEDLMKQLKQWRAEQARKDGKAAYMVATNRVLQMIAGYLPQTVDELKQIPGFGEVRSANYGPAIFEIVKGLEREHHFPLDWIPGKINREEFGVWCENEEKRRLQTQSDRAANKQKLLEAISQAGGLTELEALLSIKRRELVLSIEELDKEGYDVEALVEAELSSVDPGDQQQAGQLFRELGDRYLKPVLNKLYSEQELEGKDVNRIYEWLRLYRMKYRRQAAAV